MGETEVSLDHVAVMVPDLDPAEADYARMGFLLTPRSSHRGPVGDSADIEPWGTGNHCAMFRTGYFELLGITDRELFHDHVRARLDRYTGLHLIALGCRDAEATAAAVRERTGRRPELIDIGRDVPFGSGTRPGRFRIIHLPEGSFPEAELFFIEQATPEVLWQPSLLSHENRVSALAGVTLCSAAPEATARRLATLTAIEPDAEDKTYVFRFSSGWMEIADPGTIAARYPGAAIPSAPCVVAVTFGTSDMDATGKLLGARGVPLRAGPGDGIWVDPTAAQGAILEFVPERRAAENSPNG